MPHDAVSQAQLELMYINTTYIYNYDEKCFNEGPTGPFEIIRIIEGSGIAMPHGAECRWGEGADALRHLV